jgi:transcriptional regulator with XRE-family HTH domain
MTKIVRPSIRKKTTKPEPRSPISADIEMGKRIRDRRNEMKMSQNELAAILGVSFQQVQKYEKGTNRVTAHRLALIASTFKVRPDELYQTQDVLPDVSSLIDITDKTTLRMLKAYGGIKDQATRRQMVELIETIADAQ